MDLQYEARGNSLVNTERPPIRGASIHLDHFMNMTPKILNTMRLHTTVKYGCEAA